MGKNRRSSLLISILALACACGPPPAQKPDPAAPGAPGAPQPVSAAPGAPQPVPAAPGAPQPVPPAPGASQPLPAAIEAGIVVEEVIPGRAAHRAGLRAGDVLTSWRRGETGGTLATPRELDRVEIEEAPLGAVTLLGSRGGSPLRATFPPGGFGVTVRPPLAPARALLYDRWRTRIKDPGAPADAPARRELLERLAGDDRELRVWLLLRAAETRLAAGDPETASELFDRAAVAAAGERHRAWIEKRRGDALVAARRGHDAEAPYRAALARHPEPGPARATLLREVAFALYRQTRLEESRAVLDDSLALWRELAPGSHAEATTLLIRFMIERRTGEKRRAEETLERVLALAERRDPGGPLVAQALSFRGLIEGAALDEVERIQRRALAIYRRLGTAGEPLGMAHMWLGITLWQRGDLASAEAEFAAAREIFEAEVPGSPTVAWAVQNLGLVAKDRGDLDAAQALFEHSLRLRRASRPDGAPVAISLTNLGSLAVMRGDPAAARAHLEAALAIRRRYPGSPEEAYLLGSLADLELEVGDLERAAELYDAAKRIFDRTFPGGLKVAESFYGLARVRAAEGRRAEAERLHGQALAIRERLAPRSAAEAESLHALGVLHRDAGRRAAARRYFERAIAALEDQGTRLGGAQASRARFASRYAHVYKDLIDLLLEDGERDAAFEVLERYRGRQLLALLARRDLRFETRLPAPIAAARRELAREIERVQGALAALGAGAEDEIRALRLELLALRERRNLLAQEVVRAAPRLAALETPAPLVARDAARLDPGTLVLSYALGEEKTRLFVLGPDPADALRVATLDAGAAALAERVEAFRHLLRAPAGGEVARDALRARGRALHDLLVGPAADRLARSERVLIVPDGALHLLPFGALVAPGGRYLVERRPLHVVLSLTLYRELLEARPAKTGGPTLAAFGDPDYPEALDAVPEDVRRRRGRLTPLPATRDEVEALARLYERAGVFLGAAATEERLKATAGGVDVLHLACHGFFDARSPLDSYLALSIPKPGAGRGDNGLLQAWEIFESVRLDAELVTLSACDTGLGAELGGEGLVGLTRAFQFAGARSVVASSWSIADQSTAPLMVELYAALRAGASKSEALRRAQLALLRGRVAPPVETPWGQRLRRFLLAGRRAWATDERPAAAPSWTHPYYWAAFQLTGDWR